MPSALETAIRRTRRQIDTLEGPVRQEMADLYARAVRNLATDLELVTMQIRNAQEAGIDVSPDWLRRQDRYTRLLWQAEREFALFTDDGVRLIEGGRVRAIRGGAAEAWELLDAAGIERGFAANVPTYAIENAMSATYSGPVARSLARYGEEGSQTITDTLLDGMVRGRGPRAIIRDIQRALLSPANAARLESLVRTEAMRGFRAGLNEQYASMAHLISGYRWVAAKSVRTCLACLARDGRVQKEPWDQFHIRCRCVNSPVVKGVTIPYQNGEDWFAGQSPERQQRMMPSRQAWDAYRAGSVKLGDFVGVHRDRTWGSAVYQRSGRDVLGRVTPKAPPTVRRFASNAEAQAWAEKEFKDWPASLTKTERVGVEDYQGDDYYDINPALRNKDTTSIAELQPKIDILDQAVERGTIPESVSVYRAVSGRGTEPFLRDDAAGLVFTDSGFMSTSMRQDFAQGRAWGPASSGKQSAVVEIIVPQGTQAGYLNGWFYEGLDEYEILLGRNHSFRVVSSTTKRVEASIPGQPGFDIPHIVVEMLP